MSTPLANIDWTETGIVPTTGLEFWHQYEYGVSDHYRVLDYSGHGRDLTCAATDAPTLTQNVINGQPGWSFNGTTSIPLTNTADVDVSHVFVLASVNEATFSTFRGLLSSPITNWGLVGDNSGTKFFDLSGSVTYRKNNVEFAHANMQAPMNAFALLEYVVEPSIAVEGLQVGQQTTFTDRRHKGYFVEQMGWSRVLDRTERRRVHLHFNLKYGLWRAPYSLPFYFPSKDLIPMTGDGHVVHNRFRDVPRDWKEVTDDYTYADGGRDFNTVSDDAPRRWEYVYQNISKLQKVAFDEFSDAAKINNPFYFKDPEGVVWSNVRIEQYDRNHDAHKRWMQTASYTLVGFNSTAVFEGAPDDEPPSVPPGLTATAESDTEILLEWGAAVDPADITPPGTPPGLAEEFVSSGSFIVSWEGVGE